MFGTEEKKIGQQDGMTTEGEEIYGGKASEDITAPPGKAGTWSGSDGSAKSHESKNNGPSLSTKTFGISPNFRSSKDASRGKGKGDLFAKPFSPLVGSFSDGDINALAEAMLLEKKQSSAPIPIVQQSESLETEMKEEEKTQSSNDLNSEYKKKIEELPKFTLDKHGEEPSLADNKRNLIIPISATSEPQKYHTEGRLLATINGIVNKCATATFLVTGELQYSNILLSLLLKKEYPEEGYLTKTGKITYIKKLVNTLLQIEKEEKEELKALAELDQVKEFLRLTSEAKTIQLSIPESENLVKLRADQNVIRFEELEKTVLERFRNRDQNLLNKLADRVPIPLEIKQEALARALAQGQKWVNDNIEMLNNEIKIPFTIQFWEKHLINKKAIAKREKFDRFLDRTSPSFRPAYARGIRETTDKIANGHFGYPVDSKMANASLEDLFEKEFVHLFLEQYAHEETYMHLAWKMAENSTELESIEDGIDGPFLDWIKNDGQKLTNENMYCSKIFKRNPLTRQEEEIIFDPEKDMEKASDTITVKTIFLGLDGVEKKRTITLGKGRIFDTPIVAPNGYTRNESNDHQSVDWMFYPAKKNQAMYTGAQANDIDEEVIPHTHADFKGMKIKSSNRVKQKQTENAQQLPQQQKKPTQGRRKSAPGMSVRNIQTDSQRKSEKSSVNESEESSSNQIKGQAYNPQTSSAGNEEQKKRNHQTDKKFSFFGSTSKPYSAKPSLDAEDGGPAAEALAAFDQFLDLDTLPDKNRLMAQIEKLPLKDFEDVLRELEKKLPQKRANSKSPPKKRLGATPATDVQLPSEPRDAELPQRMAYSETPLKERFKADIQVSNVDPNLLFFSGPPVAELPQNEANLLNSPKERSNVAVRRPAEVRGQQCSFSESCTIEPDENLLTVSRRPNSKLEQNQKLAADELGRDKVESPPQCRA